jgi:serine/threonine-protein phosphatase PGAM5
MGGRALLVCAGWFAIAASARAAEAPAPPPPAVARPAGGVHYLYLIRHGAYDRDSTVDDDRTGNGLSALGREQTKLLAARLAALPVRFAHLVSSDFTRARETADVMAPVLRMTPERDSLIHECPPASERPPRDDRHREESAHCDSSLNRAWARYATPSPAADTHDLLVCHGNVIRWFVSRALGMDTRRWPVMDIANASLTIIAVRADGTTRLVMFSDVGHLPLADQTWTGRGAGWR